MNTLPLYLSLFLTMSEHHHAHGHSHGQCDHAHGGPVQCDHSAGVGGAEFDDPLFQKQDWGVEDWLEMYEKFPDSNEKGQPSKVLVKYLKEILPSEPGRVLLPLCGKSPDLRWLYDRGNTVVGIECSEKVVKNFFETYPDLKHTVHDLPYGKVYKSEDERLQVYICNVIHIPEGELGEFDAVFDWAAYTAINTKERQKYVDIMKSCMRSDSRYFLEVCHDLEEGAKGTPNSISFRTIKLEFGWDRKMKFLETKDISDEWNVKSFFNTFLMFVPN